MLAQRNVPQRSEKIASGGAPCRPLSDPAGVREQGQKKSRQALLGTTSTRLGCGVREIEATRDSRPGIATIDVGQIKKTTRWRVSRWVDAPENPEGCWCVMARKSLAACCVLA